MRWRLPPSKLSTPLIWIDLYWQEYSVAFAPQLARAAALTAKGGTPSPAETAELENFGQQFTVGFCLGGYSKVENRVPFAYQTIFDPRLANPSPATFPINVPMYWARRIWFVAF
jgi:hypothetical protein